MKRVTYKTTQNHGRIAMDVVVKKRNDLAEEVDQG